MVMGESRHDLDFAHMRVTCPTAAGELCGRSPLRGLPFTRRQVEWNRVRDLGARRCIVGTTALHCITFITSKVVNIQGVFS
jgi:hypothetical protein